MFLRGDGHQQSTVAARSQGNAVQHQEATRTIPLQVCISKHRLCHCPQLSVWLLPGGPGERPVGAVAPAHVAAEDDVLGAAQRCDSVLRRQRAGALKLRHRDADRRLLWPPDWG